jgi:hypothetical protein
MKMNVNRFIQRDDDVTVGGRIENRVHNQKNAGQIRPFHYAAEDYGESTDIDKMVTNFNLINGQITDQREGKFEIEGEATPCNNPRKHLGAEKSFGVFLETAKGQNIRHIIKELKANNGGRIICPKEGYRVDIKQPDGLDSYAAYMDDDWDRDPARCLIEIIESAPRTLTTQGIFVSLRNLIAQIGGDDIKVYYDAYVFILIVLFNWAEFLVIHRKELTKKMEVARSSGENFLSIRDSLRESEAIHRSIDEFINLSWKYVSDQKITLRDVRNKCINCGCMFEERTPLSIKETIDEASPGTVPNRRDVSHLTIVYSPSALYDDWVIDELITSLFRSLAKKRVRLNEGKRNIRAQIRRHFFESRATINRKLVTKINIDLHIVYDYNVLEVFGIKPSDLTRKDMIAKEGTFELVLEFEGCVSDSISEPSLGYTLKIGDTIHITDAKLKPAAIFDLNLAYKFLSDKIGDRSMPVLKRLREQLSTTKEDTWNRYDNMLLSEVINKYTDICGDYVGRSSRAKASLLESTKTAKEALEEYKRDGTPELRTLSANASSDMEKKKDAFNRAEALAEKAVAAFEKYITDPIREQAKAELERFKKPERVFSGALSFLQRPSDDEPDIPDDYVPLSLPDGFYDAFPMAYDTDESVVLEILPEDNLGKYERFVFNNFNASDKQAYVDIYARDEKPTQNKIETGSKLRAQRFDILMHGLNVLDVSDIDLSDQRFRENGDIRMGLHPHQLKTVKTIAKSLSKNTRSLLILAASLGAGKTTIAMASAKVAQLLALQEGIGLNRPFIIYTSNSKTLLREIFNRTGNLGLLTIAVSLPSEDYKGAGNDVMFRRFGKGDDRKLRIQPNELKGELSRCNLIVCHVRTLAYLLQLFEQKDDRGRPVYTDRPYSTIVDEVSTDGLNSESEHAIGAILAFEPHEFNRAKNIAIFSASVKIDGPIRYLMNRSENTTFITNSTILVPTTLYQLGSEDILLDVYMGYNDPDIIAKVDQDAFFRRFISSESIKQLKDLEPENIRDGGRRGRLEAISESTNRYLEKMDRYSITENHIIYSMFPHHREIRRLMPEKFEPITYDVDDEDQATIKSIFNVYLAAIGKIPSDIIGLCDSVISKCAMFPEDINYRILKKYVEGYLRETFDTSRRGMKDYLEEFYSRKKILAFVRFYGKSSLVREEIGPITELSRYIRSIRYWICTNRVEFRPSLEKLRYISDEFYTIRRCEYYAMVATIDPSLLMTSIYSAVKADVSKIITAFEVEHRVLLHTVRNMRTPVLTSREITASRLYNEYLRYEEAVSANEIGKLIIRIAPRDYEVNTFEMWLYYMKNNTDRDAKGERRNDFTNIGYGQFQKSIGIRDGGRGGQVSILDALKSYEEKHDEPESNISKIRKLISELNKKCDTIVEQHRFNHTAKVDLSVDDICNGKDVFSVIGVFAPDNIDDITAIGNRRYNRLFCDKRFAHGLDIPLEAVIFTGSVNEGDGQGKTYSADDILQQSGRCGRPSKSNTSAVYMSSATYKKCLTGNATGAITNILLRYKYYCLESGAHTVNLQTAPEPNYNDTEVFMLHERMARTKIF